MAKPARTAVQLHALLIERIEAIPDLRGRVTDVHQGYVVGVVSDGEGGPNWMVWTFANVTKDRTDIAQIIRTLQGQFDLKD